MKSVKFALVLFPTLAIGTLQAAERDIALEEVPALVLQAAEAAVPGFVAREAEVEEEDGVTVYELEGRSSKDGLQYEIEISSDGKVLEIEQGDDEEEGDD